MLYRCAEGEVTKQKLYLISVWPWFRDTYLAATRAIVIYEVIHVYPILRCPAGWYGNI